MIHEEYRLSEEKLVEQNKRMFDWSLRSVETLTVPRSAKEILVDTRLKDYYLAIKRFVHGIALESGEELEKVEVIIGRWELDENFSSVFVRWASPLGTFMRELGTTTVIETHHVFIGMPTIDHSSVS